ncbi:MAG: ImmA/IrrE family metallo-endopeptidase [Defluviitaleaceae bacterium]|nr:ImmA/IrrE family metallo-endopeptidase [Defluviitaleaceae bacterium]
MAEKITAVNGEILKWARIESKTPLEYVEKKFKNIHKWENGDDYPTYAQLKMLGDYYRKPIAVFFFPEPPMLRNLPSSFRTLPDIASSVINRELVKIIDWARVMQINLYEMNDEINPSINQLVHFNFDLSNLNTTAKQLRELFKANLSIQKKFSKPFDAFEFWRDCFHITGVYIFKEAFKNNDVSGFCIYDDVFPIICINNTLSPSRQIFTLFHEAYHLIHKIGGIDLLDDRKLGTKYYDGYEIEVACNQFAGEFLVPTEDFVIELREIGEVNNNAVEQLAKMYSVSREVIMRKLLNIGRINRSTYEDKRNEYNQDWFRNNEDDKNKKSKSTGNYFATQLTYKGRQYTELAFNGYYAQKYNITQLAHYMGMKIQSVQTIATQKGWGVL